MLFTLLLALTVTVVTCREQFIINGGDADIADYQYQGSVRTAEDTLICGCVLIHQDWAITAAHCVSFSNQQTTRWGTTSHTDGVQIGIAEKTLHPGFGQGDEGAWPHDIAVLLLSEPATGENMSPISMATERINSGMGIITGWGLTCGSCDTPDVLQWLEIPVISDEQSVTYWGDDYNPEAHICVFGNDTGACHGDAGGPLVVDGELQGLFTWGYAECLTEYPSTYVRATTYRDWVCQQTNGQGC